MARFCFLQYFVVPFLIKEIIHPDWRGYFKEQWENLLKGLVPPTYEYQVIHKDGNVRWINRRNTLKVDEDGCPTAIEGVVTDITARKNAEYALVRSEAHLRILVDTIPDLVWLKDPDGFYLACNPTFERFFGSKQSAIIGKTDYDFVSKDLADFFREHDQKAMEADGPSVNEEWLTFADDGYHGLFETIKTPMRNPDGKIIGVLGIARDMTERKRSEEALKLNERRYKSAQRMGNVGNWEYDLVTESFWGSDQAKQIYGFDPKSEQFTIDEVENCIPERDRVHQALVDLIETDIPYDIEFDIHPVSGPKRLIHSTAALIRDGQDVPLKVTGVIQDITRQKAAEKEKRLLEQQLTQAQKMESIGRLAGGVAHDFNNMLSIIIGNTELAIARAEETNPLVSNLKQIHKAAERSTHLTRQLLAFARKQSIVPRLVNLNHRLHDMRSMLQRLIGEDIDLAWLSAKQLWSVKIDPSHIDQILANLCINARDAIDGVGKVSIWIGNVVLDEVFCQKHTGSSPGSFVMLTISDTGSGMDKATIQNILLM